MLSFKKASLVVLARAYCGGYMCAVSKLPTTAELPLLKGNFIEAIPICIDGKCEFNSEAAGHACTYEVCLERAKFPDHDCCYVEHYLEIANKVTYRISATDKGRTVFEKGISRQERIYLLLEMKEWRWSLFEVNKLAASELSEFLSHERQDIRKAALARLNTLIVLGEGTNGLVACC